MIFSRSPALAWEVTAKYSAIAIRMTTDEDISALGVFHRIVVQVEDDLFEASPVRGQQRKIVSH